MEFYRQRQIRRKKNETQCDVASSDVLTFEKLVQFIGPKRGIVSIE